MWGPVRYVCDVTLQQSSPENEPYITEPGDREIVSETLDVECSVPSFCNLMPSNTVDLRLGRKLESDSPEVLETISLGVSSSPAPTQGCDLYFGQVDTTKYKDGLYELQVEARYDSGQPVVSHRVEVILTNRIRQSIVDYARSQVGGYYIFGGHVTSNPKTPQRISYEGSWVGVHSSTINVWNANGPPGKCPATCQNAAGDHCGTHAAFLYRTTTSAGAVRYWERCSGVTPNNLDASPCKDTSHFDCIGLVCESYKDAGFTWSDSTPHIWTVGNMRSGYINSIQRNKIQSGDLAFWGNSHIGVVAKGSGGSATDTVIEARGHAQGVEENNLDGRNPGLLGIVKKEYWLKALGISP